MYDPLPWHCAFLYETTPASFYPNVMQKATFLCNRSALPMRAFLPPLFCELFFVGRGSRIGKPCLLRVLFCSVRRKRNSAHRAGCNKRAFSQPQNELYPSTPFQILINESPEMDLNVAHTGKWSLASSPHTPPALTTTCEASRHGASS